MTKIYRTTLSEVKKLVKEQQNPPEDPDDGDLLEDSRVYNAMVEGIQPLVDSLKRRLVRNLKRYAREHHLEYNDVYTIISEIPDDEPNLAIVALMDTAGEEE
jgi:hypothetical protein